MCTERWSYLEEGQYVNDELVGFGRRVQWYNYMFSSRIGYGIDNGDRGRDADNFKLQGYGKIYNNRNNTETIGLFENDKISKKKD